MSRAAIKATFETGDAPTQAQFATFINEALPIVYVDSRAANDSGDGGSSTPKKTLAAAVALLVEGGTLSLARTGRWHEMLDLSGKQFISIVAHGDGELPIVDGSRLIPAASWHADPGARAGVYYADVTHVTAMGELAGINYQYKLFEETSRKKPWETLLTRKLDGGSISANLDWIRDHPGSFTVHGQGSAVANPIGLGLTAVRYWISTADGSSPASNDIPVYYCEAEKVGYFDLGTNLTDIIFQRCAGKDTLGSTQFGPVGKLTRVFIYDATCHGTVLQGGHYEDCHFYGNYVEFEQAGGAIVLYRSATDNGPGDTRIVNCSVTNFSAGMLEHGNGVSPFANNRLVLRNFTAYRCRHAFLGGPWKHGIDGDGINAIECMYAFALTGIGHRIKNVKYISSEGSFQPQSTIFRAFVVLGNQDGIESEATIENFECIFTDESGAYTSFADCYENSTLNLIRGTNVGGKIPSSPGYREGTWNLTDVCLGSISPTYAQFSEWPIANFSAVNSQFDFGAKTLEEIQAHYPGTVDDDCIVPFYRQPYVHEVEAAEVSYEDSPFAYTATGVAGDAFFRSAAFATIVDTFKRIRIAGVGAAGADLHLVDFTTDPGNNGGGGEKAYTLGLGQTTLPNSFSSVLIELQYFNKTIWPQYAGTALLDPDLDHVRLSNPEHFCVGQFIRLGAVAGQKPLGLFQITALVGAVATLDRDVKWQFYSVGGGDTIYASHTGAAGQPCPTVVVNFGFPLIPKLVTGRVGLNGTIEFAEGGSPLAFGEDTQYSVMSPRTAGTLTSSGAYSAYVYWSNDKGEITNGFPVNEGDVIDLAWLVKIPEYEPQYVVDPIVCKQVLIEPRSILSERGIGYQGRGVTKTVLGINRFGNFDPSTLPKS